MLQQIPESIKELSYKAADSVISVKFLLLAVSTLLFYKGILDQNGWLMITLSVSGMRTLNEVAAIVKGSSEDKK